MSNSLAIFIYIETCLMYKILLKNCFWISPNWVEIHSGCIYGIMNAMVKLANTFLNKKMRYIWIQIETVS